MSTTVGNDGYLDSIGVSVLVAGDSMSAGAHLAMNLVWVESHWTDMGWNLKDSDRLKERGGDLRTMFPLREIGE